MKVLVIGGTGPTGPFIVHGLVERGHDVTLLHSGRHELDALPPESIVPLIHTDPFDAASFEAALAGRTFDVVFVMYGRLRAIAQILRGRVGHLITIGGIPVYAGFSDADIDIWPQGMRIPTRENAPVVGDAASERVRRIASTEALVFDLHPNAVHFRYPYIYGPHQLLPVEWTIVRRALDKRPVLLLADGGRTIMGTAYSGNAAHTVLLGFDHLEANAGEAFNVADDRQFDRAQVAEIVADELGHEWEVIGLPHEVARPASPTLQSPFSNHQLLDNAKARERLGYRDRYDPEAALRETVRWQREYLHGRSEEADKRLQDPFDYATEDRFIEAYRHFSSACKAIEFAREPGYGYGYYGTKDNPAGKRGSYLE